MKVTCSKSNLLNGLQIVSKAVSSKQTSMSILECILMEATANEIKLTANDTEIGIETVFEGKSEEPGTIALDAKLLLDIIRNLPENDITISVDDSLNVTITCEKSTFHIVGRDGREFSYLPVIEKNDSIVISEFSLKEIIRQTIFAINVNDSNKMLSGELFEIKGNVLRVVGMDGHKIAIRKITMKDTYADKRVIVPGKTLNEIVKILGGDTSKDVTISFTDKHVLFEFDNTIVVSRLIEGNYFNIDQMLSSDYETKISVNKKEMADCINRASLMVNEGDKRPVIMIITDNQMEMKINSSKGSLDEFVETKKEGKDIMIGFNPRFLLDTLKVIDDEIIDVFMVNAKAPCYIKAADGSYVYMVLPVNFTTV